MFVTDNTVKEQFTEEFLPEVFPTRQTCEKSHTKFKSQQNGIITNGHSMVQFIRP